MKLGQCAVEERSRAGTSGRGSDPGLSDMNAISRHGYRPQRTRFELLPELTIIEYADLRPEAVLRLQGGRKLCVTTVLPEALAEVVVLP
jgi:hypothetical protein